MTELNITQKKVLGYIRSFTNRNGFPPTLREIADKMGFSSTNGARYHLKVLQKQGFLQHRKGSRRGLKVVEERVLPLLTPKGRRSHADPKVVALPTGQGVPAGDGWWEPLPVIGRVAAGAPILAEENREGEIGVDQGLFGGGPGIALFGLQVSGESMRDAGILDGDLAVVRKSEVARPHEIIVAIVNDEATVKRYEPDNECVVLRAENPLYQDIIVTAEDRFLIAGVVVGIIRKQVH